MHIRNYVKTVKYSVQFKIDRLTDWNQHWNRVTITDPDDPLTWIVIQVRPGLINVGACTEKYIRWFYAQFIGSVLQRIINSWDKYADCVASYNLQAKDIPHVQSWTAPTLGFLSHSSSSKCSYTINDPFLSNLWRYISIVTVEHD